MVRSTSCAQHRRSCCAGRAPVHAAASANPHGTATTLRTLKQDPVDVSLSPDGSLVATLDEQVAQSGPARTAEVPVLN